MTGYRQRASQRAIAVLLVAALAGVWVASLACRIPIIQFYWNGMLKKNGAWERRFAAPYGPAFEG